MTHGTLVEEEPIEVSVATQPKEIARHQPRPLLVEKSSGRDERPIFGDSLLDSTTVQRRRLRGATLCSYLFQMLLVGILVLIPLMYTETLPTQELLTYLVVAPPPPPPPPPAAAVSAAPRMHAIESDVMNGQLRMPTRIPEKVRMITEKEAPPSAEASGGVVGGVPGGVPGGQLGGVIGGIIGAVNTSNTKFINLPPPKPVQRVRVSQGVSLGMLVRQFKPEYPKIASDARVQGAVVLAAVIGKDGTIQNLHVLSGHPLLVNAAMSAVQQWQFRPYMLNGEPIEVETIVTVTFHLGE